MTDKADHQTAFELRQAVPWGRNRAEYEAFFDLAGVSTDAPLLDCAAGPSSFAAEMSGHAQQVIAIDPVYGSKPSAIAQHFEEAATLMLEGLRKSHKRFLWDSYGTPENLIADRRSTLHRFLADYAQAARKGHYIAAALPSLPFSAGKFDLVLCSHFLFLYGHLFDEKFHARSITEMLRVGREVRIFPLLGLDGNASPHLEPVRRQLAKQGLYSEIRPVPYEFQRGGNRMLCVSSG